MVDIFAGDCCNQIEALVPSLSGRCLDDQLSNQGAVSQ